jgi:hypothetical protein
VCVCVCVLVRRWGVQDSQEPMASVRTACCTVNARTDHFRNIAWQYQCLAAQGRFARAE